MKTWGLPVHVISPTETPISRQVFCEVTRITDVEYDEAIPLGIIRRCVDLAPDLPTGEPAHNLFDLVEYTLYQAIGTHLSFVAEQDRRDTAEELVLAMADAYDTLLEFWDFPTAFEIIESTSAGPLLLRLTDNLKLVGDVYATLNATLLRLERNLGAEVPFSFMYWDLHRARRADPGSETIIVLVPGTLSTGNMTPRASSADTVSTLPL